MSDMVGIGWSGWGTMYVFGWQGCWGELDGISLLFQLLFWCKDRLGNKQYFV